MSALETDLDLMLRVKQGDTACMGPLLEAHREPIVHFLYRMVQDRGVAEELAQEVFLRIYRHRDSYEPTAKFTSWLYRIATNLASNWRRHRRYEGVHESLDAMRPGEPKRELRDRNRTIDQLILDDEGLSEIRDAIAALPVRQRAMVLMHTYEEMEYREIALALNCSIPAVKSSLFRAYSDLRARLAHMSAGRIRGRDLQEQAPQSSSCF